MSLRVFINKNDIPDGSYVKFNDDFFDGNTLLADNDIIRRILSEIDNAEYVSESIFSGRTDSLNGILKDYLSTGSKTLINIISHPDKCFDVCECGNNALKLLTQIDRGMVYWRVPVVLNVEDSCDIVMGEYHFDTVYDFMVKVQEVYDEER